MTFKRLLIDESGATAIEYGLICCRDRTRNSPDPGHDGAGLGRRAHPAVERVRVERARPTFAAHRVRPRRLIGWRACAVAGLQFTVASHRPVD